jgi:hypothetical protein
VTELRERRLHEDQALIHLGRRLAELCRIASSIGSEPEAERLVCLDPIRREMSDLLTAISRLSPASEEGREVKSLADQLALSWRRGPLH